MQVEIQINNSTSASARFVTWSPAPCRVRMTDATGATAPTANGMAVPVELRSPLKMRRVVRCCSAEDQLAAQDQGVGGGMGAHE